MTLKKLFPWAKQSNSSSTKNESAPTAAEFQKYTRFQSRSYFQICFRKDTYLRNQSTKLFHHLLFFGTLLIFSIGEVCRELVWCNVMQIRTKGTFQEAHVRLEKEFQKDTCFRNQSTKLFHHLLFFGTLLIFSISVVCRELVWCNVVQIGTNGFFQEAHVRLQREFQI